MMNDQIILQKLQKYELKLASTHALSPNYPIYKLKIKQYADMMNGGVMNKEQHENINAQITTLDPIILEIKNKIKRINDQITITLSNYNQFNQNINQEIENNIKNINDIIKLLNNTSHINTDILNKINNIINTLNELK